MKIMILGGGSAIRRLVILAALNAADADSDAYSFDDHYDSHEYLLSVRPEAYKPELEKREHEQIELVRKLIEVVKSHLPAFNYVVPVPDT